MSKKRGQLAGSRLKMPLNFWHIATLLFVTALTLIPLFQVVHPPLSDYPNHIARMHILASDVAKSELNQFYRIQWALLPNLSMDLIVPGLSKIFGLNLAGKIFLGVTLVSILSGTFALHAALHGHISRCPLLAFFFLYNSLFLFGVVNFLFGLGLCLWSIAGWIFASRRCDSNISTFLFRGGMLSAFSFIIFICHLSSYIVFVICICSYELQRATKNYNYRDRWCQLIVYSLACVVPAGVFIFFSPTINLATFNFHGLSVSDYLEASILRKIFVPLALISNYNSLVDACVFLLLGLSLIRGVFRGAIYINYSAKFILISILLAFLLAPFSAFGSSMADTRIFLALCFLFIAAIEVKQEAKKSLVTAISVSLGVLFFIRLQLLNSYWHEEDKTISQFIGAMDNIPRGARLFIAFSETNDSNNYFNSLVRYLPCLAIIEKAAFVPSLYALEGAQPNLFTADFQKIKERTPGPLVNGKTSFDWPQIRKDYDYIWTDHIGGLQNFPSDKLEMVVDNSHFMLYRIVK